jgi:molybdenum cofactor cytidylyltransferase
MRDIGAIILAAGGATRFGGAKQLVKFRGETLVRRSLRAATEGGCAPVAVVVGDFGSLVKAELAEAPGCVVENPEWRRGIGTSIRCGLRFLLGSRPELDVAIVLACDQPFVEGGTVAALIAERRRSGKAIVASHYANTLGIPALFDRSCFAALLALPDDSGAKAVVHSQREEVASVEFEKGAIDIDTLADFERLTS